MEWDYANNSVMKLGEIDSKQIRKQETSKKGRESIKDCKADGDHDHDDNGDN